MTEQFSERHAALDKKWDQSFRAQIKKSQNVQKAL